MSDPTKPIRALSNHAGSAVEQSDAELPDRELAQRRRPTSIDDIRRLRGRVETHLDRLEEAALTDGSIAVQRGAQIAGVLATLIGDAAKLDGSGRATLRAAI